MKKETSHRSDRKPGPRMYRQGARALATKANETRILDAFEALLADRWLDAVTLESVAAEAGVTAQTVIRKYGGKEGLLRALADRIKDEVIARRRVAAGDIDAILAVLVEDYEIVGDLVCRLLAQEERYPMLTAFLNVGRTHHRGWTAEMFAPALASLAPESRERSLDALVCATDLYLWKLLRRDFGYPPSRVVDVMRRLLTGALQTLNTEPLIQPKKTRRAMP